MAENPMGASRFNWYALGRGPYWSKQREIARSVERYPTTLVPTGNAVGKTYYAAGQILQFLYEHPESLVICTAPTQTQLEEVLWKEVRRAHDNAVVRLDGVCYQSPLKIVLPDGSKALGYSTTKTERLSGHHAEHLLAVIDEASGVDPEIISAVDSLNPSRLLMIGNPLRPDGPFHERCMAAWEKPSDLTNVIQIASNLNPDAGKARSTRGLADATWLVTKKNDYGEGSLWWTTHVEGLFPDSGVDTVIPRHWINLASQTIHLRDGPTRTAIDLAEGKGGDRTVVMTRDNNGILALESSNRWSLEVAATRAALQVQQFGVEHSRVTYDVNGIGSDFQNRLTAVGIHGARPYRGGAGGGKRFGNLRSYAAWMLRQRLDPDRMAELATGLMVKQHPFAIKPEWVGWMREELQGLRYGPTNSGGIVLEIKEDFAARLRRSPDFADTLMQSFAFPE